MPGDIRLRIGVGAGTYISLPRGSSVSWGLSYGVQPLLAEIETDRSRAEEILAAARYQFPGASQERSAAAGPLSLVLEAAGEVRTFQRLFALTVKAGSKRARGRLVFTDCRYWWPFQAVERAYNVRRSSGNFRLVGGVLEETKDREADFTWRRSSLRPDGEPWTARDALADVMEILEPGMFDIPPEVIPYEDWTDGVTLRGDGASELARVLSFLPGVHPLVLPSGRVTFGNVHDGSEAAIAEHWLPFKRAGDVRLTSRASMRWGTCRVFFPRELELRLDFEDVGGDQASANSVAPDEPPPIFENVVPCPLYSLEVPARGRSTQGEYIPLPDYIAAFNALKASKSLVRQDRGNLTQADIRECWLGKWEALLIDHCAYSTLTEYDGELSLMLGALQAHYRGTFRISSVFMDRIISLAPLRAAVMNPETGTRAKAAVFANWLEKINQQGYIEKLAIEHLDWAENLAEAKASPFDVEVLDADAGVFRVVPRLNQQGTASDRVIGQAASPIPTSSINDVSADIWADVALEKGFKLSVVMSAIQDAPNDLRRLHCEVVTLGQALEHLGRSAGAEALGPDQGLHVMLDTARFGWVDDRADDILAQLYGTVGGETDALLEPGAESPLAGLMVNQEGIRALALAAAAEDLSRRLDRYQGAMVVGHAPDVVPTGNLRQVVWTLTKGSNGHSTVEAFLDFPGEVEPVSAWAQLDEQTRRVVRREVRP